MNVFINLNKIMCRDPTLGEDTKLQSPWLQPIVFQAPTWTSQSSNLVTLRHQPLGLQPYLWRRLQPGLLRTPIL